MGQQMKAFIENIGHASTTAWLYSKRLGHSVNAAAYTNGTLVTVQLENAGAKVARVPKVNFETIEAYEAWKASCPEGLDRLLHGLRLFNCTTAFDANNN